MVDQIVAIDGRAGLSDGGVGIGPVVDCWEVGLIDCRCEQRPSQIVAGSLHPLLPPHLLCIGLGDRQAALCDQMVDEGEVPDFVRRLEGRGDDRIEGGEKDKQSEEEMNTPVAYCILRIA